MGAILLGMPLPLVATQILWIDVIESGLPSAALAFGKDKAGLMKHKPQGTSRSLFNQNDKKWLISLFIISGVILFLTYFFTLKITNDIDLTRTVVFALTGIDSILLLLILSSLHQPIWRRDLFSNWYIVGATIFGIPLMILAIYLPVLQAVLTTVSLSIGIWLIIIALALVKAVLLEITKYCFLVKRIK
jgi:Ca2+-transporting ATPase